MTTKVDTPTQFKLLNPDRHKFHICNHQRTTEPPTFQPTINRRKSIKRPKNLNIIDTETSNSNKEIIPKATPEIPILINDADSSIVNDREKGSISRRSSVMLNLSPDYKSTTPAMRRISISQHVDPYSKISVSDCKLTPIRKNETLLPNRLSPILRKPSFVGTPTFKNPPNSAVDRHNSFSGFISKNDFNARRNSKFLKQHDRKRNSVSPKSFFNDETISCINEDSNENYTFGSTLSRTGQCAMLKSYEDELYGKLKSKHPEKELPRIPTPTFNLSRSRSVNSKRFSTSSDIFSPAPSCASVVSSVFLPPETVTKENDSIISLDTIVNNESEHFAKYKVSKQIESAMDILDDIKKIEERSDDENEFDNAVKKYEIWHKNWSKMLDELF